MNENHPTHSELFDQVHSLALACLEQTATPEQVAELDRLICDNSEARRLYVRYVHTSLSLRAWAENPLPPEDQGPTAEPVAADERISSAVEGRASSEETVLPTNAIPPMPNLQADDAQGGGWLLGNNLPLFSLLGAVVVVGAFAAWWVVKQLGPGEPPANLVTKQSGGREPKTERNNLSSAAPVARLTLADGCRWLDGHDSPEAGEALTVGRSLHLASGVVEITFDVGVRIILQGPASFGIESPKSARLTMGKLTAEITSPEAHGFKVLTPEAVLVDQGTEFGVEVAPGGSSRVHVFNGEVDVTLNAKEGASAATQRLTANEGARMEKDAAHVRLFQETGESFVRSMDQAHRDRHVVAYWRFEDRPVGEVVPDTQENTKPIRGTIDSSFNGNDLFTHIPRSQPRFSGDVPVGVVPRTGQPNRGCLDNTEPLTDVHTRDVYTRSAFSHASPIDIQQISPPQWTIEASVKAKNWKRGVQTFVGRDAAPAFPVSDVAPRLAFQVTAEGRLAIHFRDEEDCLHEAVAAKLALAEGHWYHVAAVSNGMTLLMYADALDGAGYRLVARTDLPTTGSTALSNGSNDAEWSIGRGKKGGHPAEWFQGWIDEVRISDVALDPSEFLFSAKKKALENP